MERLPYIDEHVAQIRARTDDTWTALTAVMAGATPKPGIAVDMMLRPDPGTLTGDWTDVRADNTIVGFRVTEARPNQRLALAGKHNFSRYRLVFDMETVENELVVLHARSWGEFPGVPGRIYRGLVIGTGGHRLVMSMMLRRIKRQAERQAGARKAASADA